MSERGSESGEWYYDLVTGEVTRGKRRGATNRMGPYASVADATRAMERAKERNEAWREEDEAWENER